MMNEFRRVFCSLRCWTLLLMLLLVSVFLMINGDTHSTGFYKVYQKELASFEGRPTDEILENLRKTEESLRAETDPSQGPDLRLEAVSALIGQLEYMTYYQDYLDTVHRNAEEMSSMSIFHDDEDPFEQRNIEKTDRDFPKTVALSLGNDYAVEHLITDKYAGYALLVFLMFVVLSFLEERKTGLWSLVHGARNGRIVLCMKRIGILAAASLLGTLVLFGGYLAVACLYFGSPGDLSRVVQGMQSFQHFPFVIRTDAFLAIFLLTKAAGMWLVSLLVFALMQAVRNHALAVSLTAVFLGIEYVTFRFIPDSFKLVYFRYLNVFAFVDMERVLLIYLNLNLFGIPVSGFVLTLFLAPFCLLLAITANMLFAAKKKPFSRENPLLRVAEVIRKPVSSLVSRLHSFGFELYKILISRGGIVVLAFLFLYVLNVQQTPQPDFRLYDTDKAGFALSMQKPYSESLKEELEERISYYAGWKDQAAAQKPLDALRGALQDTEESLEKQDGRWFLNPAPYIALIYPLNTTASGTNALVLFLAVILLLSPLFSNELQNGMQPLLHASPSGRKRFIWRKSAAAVLVTLLAFIIIQGRELLLIRETYGKWALQAPAASINIFDALPSFVTLGSLSAFFILLRLLTVLSVSGIICLISMIAKQNRASVLYGIAFLALPQALYCMGVEMFGWISFGRGWLPYSCSPLWLILSIVFGIAAFIMTGVLWLRKK